MLGETSFPLYEGAGSLNTRRSFRETDDDGKLIFLFFVPPLPFPLSQVTGSSDKTIRQWDVNTGQCVLTMDILWAISNPPAPPSTSSSSSSRPGSENRRRTSSFADTPGSLLSGASLLSVTSGTFAVPTPPFADGSWEMYQDFVGGVQFWGYALASGSGDGGVRMWDSEFWVLVAFFDEEFGAVESRAEREGERERDLTRLLLLLLFFFFAVRTGQAHRTLIGHTGPVTSIQFDEMHVISGSLDKTIRVSLIALPFLRLFVLCFGNLEI